MRSKRSFPCRINHDSDEETEVQVVGTGSFSGATISQHREQWTVKPSKKLRMQSPPDLSASAPAPPVLTASALAPPAGLKDSKGKKVWVFYVLDSKLTIIP